MKALVVNDMVMNRKLPRVTLEAEQHTVLEAAESREALQMLGHSPVPAIISNIFMPEMDGWRAASAATGTL